MSTITAILLRIVLATSLSVAYAAHDTRAALLGLFCLVAGCAIGSPRSLASTHLCRSVVRGLYPTLSIGPVPYVTERTIAGMERLGQP